MAKKSRRHCALWLEQLEAREAPTASPWATGTLLRESFDGAPTGTIPAKWSQWSNFGPFAVSLSQPLSGSGGLASSGTSGQTSRTWVSPALSANVQVSAAVYLNSLIPIQILARGSNLDTPAPTYYAVSVTRGLQLEVLRVVSGVATSLGQVTSASYFSSQWARVTLEANATTVRAQVMRTDTGEYLDNAGQWQASATWALSRTDSAIGSGSLAGLGRASGYSGTVMLDDFKVTGVPSGSTSPPVLIQQTFDSTAAGLVPSNWSQWSDRGPFAASTARAVSPTQSLAAAGISRQSSRAWLNQTLPRDIQAGAEVYVDSLVPAQVFVRGQGLASSTPSYYAVSVSRGLQVQVVRVVNGAAATLGQAKSATYFSNSWVWVSIYANGSNLRAQVYRPDTGQHLDSSGQWQSSVVWALNLTDTAITSGGQAGLSRPASYSGAVYFDDFRVLDFTPPSVRITSPSSGTTLVAPTTVQASASDNVGVARVDFYVDGVRKATDSAAPFTWLLDPAAVASGSHTLLARAYDSAGNSSQTSMTIQTAFTTMPMIPRHYSHIRIAELAYSGTPFGSVETQLLQNSVDLVVANPAYLTDINSAAPNTPQLIYTNASNIYTDLLTDWLNYADAHGFSREGAFYHVSRATYFSGDSSSSQPVNWFWGVYRGGLTPTFIDQTSAARTSAGFVQFGALGESIYVGYTERYREVNLSLASGAARGWSSLLEYATGVDSYGNPTSWYPLTMLTDSTSKLTRSGQITFDPPSNWKTVSIGNSARLYYVRFRTITGGTAPVANTILGRDSVNARGTTHGTIPAFDSAADLNRDGYLNNAEYGTRASGKDARFFYESRALYGNYGQMRFATNPSNAGFRSWAADYAVRFLKSQPLADGLFVDNATGKSPVAGGSVLESTSTYAADFGSLLNAIGRAIAPHWVMANTSGGGTTSDPVVRQNTAYFEEFAIRPLASNYQQFEDMAALVAHRQALRSPAPYAILDSLPTGGSPTDARTQLATLAYYYLIADPATTFLNFYGGYEPATTWSRHWSPAAAYDIGQPTSTWSLFATDVDPSNTALTYRVYQRTFTNALVLYKPLSYAPGTSMQASLGTASATTHWLGGTYRPLRADGTLGAPVTTITLRNGEGAILIKA